LFRLIVVDRACLLLFGVLLRVGPGDNRPSLLSLCLRVGRLFFALGDPELLLGSRELGLGV